MPERARLGAVVHGIVQDVSFRYYARREANQLNLTGWVKNRWDGTVEVVVEGDRNRLEKFLAWLYRGPGAAVVEKVDVYWTEATDEFNFFEVRY